MNKEYTARRMTLTRRLDVTIQVTAVQTEECWGGTAVLHSRSPILDLAVLKSMFCFVLGPTPPRGHPWEGPSGHRPLEIEDLGPILARIWRV